MDEIIATAERILPEFNTAAANITYEPRGILFSEMLFMRAVIEAVNIRPRQIVESGRARGQSALVLARCFPKIRVVSVEYEPDTEDARFAEKRLGMVPNLALLYGDSRVLLPALTLPGDVVLLDGPKRFRALRLALRLLASGTARLVFIHDLHSALPERRFLEKHFPEALFSDNEAFARRFWDLNEGMAAGAGVEYPGPTLACIPRRQGCAYSSLFPALAVASFRDRLGRHFQGHPKS